MVSVAFAREAVSADLLTEALPLLTEHWKEIATHADIPLDVDTQTYLAAAEAGVVRLFTVREAPFSNGKAPRPTTPWLKGDLVGYACFFVKPHMHYSGSTQAVQDVLYLHPSVRGGTGADFLAYCDERLREEGVQVVHHHAKLAHPQLGKALERLGYQAVETVYSRRLDVQATPTHVYKNGELSEIPVSAERYPMYTLTRDGGLSLVTPPRAARIPWSLADATNDANRTHLTDFAELMRETAGMASDGDE